MAIDSVFFETPLEIDKLAPQWDELTVYGPASPLFLSRTWVKNWMESYGGTTRNGVVAFRSGTRLVGVMPLMIGKVRRGPALNMRFDYRPGDQVFFVKKPKYRLLPVTQVSPMLGVESSNLRGGILSIPEFYAACQVASLAFLRQLRGWTVAVIPFAETEFGSWQSALAKNRLRGQFRTAWRDIYMRQKVIAWPDFLQNQKRHFRKNLVHAEREAVRHNVEARVLVGKDGKSYQFREDRALSGLKTRMLVGERHTRDGLAAMKVLADLSWKSKGRKGESMLVPLTSATVTFYKSLCTGTDEFVPVFIVLYQEESPRAVQLWMLCRNVLCACVTYYNPDIARASPGSLMTRVAFQWCWENGVERIDFNASHEWSRRFSDTVHSYKHLVVFNDTAWGRILYCLSGCLAKNSFSGDAHAPAVACPEEDEDYVEDALLVR